MELQEIQNELALIKKALRENSAFLGMSGEKLQRYFLQLNEKENLLLSKQLQQTDLLNAAGPAGTANSIGRSTGGGYANGSVAAKAPPVARELPVTSDGKPETFDRDNLAAVCTHMTRYEASIPESAKGLRALASLAYANATTVADHPDVLPQVLRTLDLHPKEAAVQISGMRALCNMAYDSAVALGKLSSAEVLGAFVTSMGRFPSDRDIAGKAAEGVARVVSAEVGPDTSPTPGNIVPQERGPLRALFTLVGPDAGDNGRDVVLQLIDQLISNEVATPAFLAQRFVDAAEVSKETAPAAAAWLMLGKAIAMKEISTMSESLIEKGAIPKAHSVMSAQEGDSTTQLSGIEAMSGLVGSRWPGLQAFANVRGIERIEVAMTRHPDVAIIQTKGIRALASGIQWPNEIQTKAGYEYKRGVELTKAAMSKHGDVEELQIAGLEALAKYLDKTSCVDEVKSGGGEGLVKAMVMRHGSNSKVKTLGTTILDSLGEKGWTPKGTSS